VPFKLVSAEGRTLRLEVEAGGPPCDGVRKVAVQETPTTVTVTVTTGWVGSHHTQCGPGAVTMLGRFPVEARLQAPLRGRTLIDGAA
jgi:hypothetical protein